MTTSSPGTISGRSLGAGFCPRLVAEHGVRMGALGPDLVRAVTHHDVDTANMHNAVGAVAAALSAAR